MIVYQAETGEILPIQFTNEITSQDELVQKIEQITRIPIQFQIILTSDGSQYRQGIQKELFLFNRQSLDQVEGVMKMSIDIEPPPTVLEIIEPITIEKLKLAFQSHKVYTRELLEIAKKHYLTCEKLMQEQTIQKRALDIAIQNLRKHRNSIFEVFQSFYAHSQKEFQKHSLLLHSFPSDLNTLHQIPVHSLISRDARNLDDYVPKDKLFAWVNRCQTAHDHLVNKTNLLAQKMEEIKIGCDETLIEEGIDFAKLSNLLETTRDLIEKIEIMLQNIEKDARKVDILMNGQIDDEQFKGIEYLYSAHREQYISEITKYDRYVRETVLYFSDSKQHLTQVLLMKLQSVAHFQSLIASVAPNIATLSKALNVQSEALLQLLHVHRMAPAWGAALVEVVRRKEYIKLFLKKAKEMADILAQFRAQEQKKRETFKVEISRYLPVGLIQGLDDQPPFCEVSVSNTQDSLPNLGIDDIMAFEKLVSSLRITSTPSDPNVGGSDSISKLQATMMKMTPQLDLVANDFEKIILRSEFADRFKRLEEENKKLRSITPSRLEFVESKTPSEVSTTPTQYKMEETIKIYEARIKSLEQVLQERYHSSKTVETDQGLSAELQKERQTIESLKKENENLKKENESLKKEIAQVSEKTVLLEKDKKEMETLYQASLLERDQMSLKQIQKDSETQKVFFIDKQKQLLLEVATHLQSCMSALKSTDESMVHFDSVLIPDSIHPDNLRQIMRKVEDDTISQMALLQNLKTSLSESAGASDDAQSIAAELVSLMQHVSELEQTIRDYESDLTEAQAREAVVEADRNSVRVLLTKTTQALEKEQGSVNKLTNELKESHGQVEALEDQLLATNRELEETKRQFESQPQQVDSTLPSLLLTKESLLRRSREALEDWSIVSRLTLEHLSMHFKGWAKLQGHTNVTRSFDISFDELLSTDPETFPDEMDLFLSSVSFLIKQTYNKITFANQTSPTILSNSIQDVITELKSQEKKKISFHSY